MSVLTEIIINGTAYDLGGSGTGLTDDAKVALLQLAQKMAYIDEDGQDYYDDLYDALYPPAPPSALSYITCSYTQSGTVYDTDTLDSLKSDLTVIAHYDNGSTAPITNYTLSGSLVAGTSTITVSYSGKTTTFNVTVTHQSVSTYNITSVGTFIRDHAYGANNTNVSDNFPNSVYSLSGVMSGDVLILPAGFNEAAWDTEKMISKTGTSSSAPNVTLGEWVQSGYNYGYYPITINENPEILYVAFNTSNAELATWTREGGF